MRPAVAIIAVVACSLAWSTRASVLFGSATPGAIFDEFNIWLRLTGGGPIQAVRIVNVPFNDPSTSAAFTNDIANLVSVWQSSGAVPLINWMPYAYSDWTNPKPNDLIADGAYDAYLDAFIATLNTSFLAQTTPARRAYVRFAPSPNGDWFPWSPYCTSCGGQSISQSAASYVRMFRHVVGKLKKAFPRDQVQVVFDLSTYSPSGNYSVFYPGHDVVDWVSLTGNNWGTTINGNSWVSPQELYAGPLGEFAQALGAEKKPIAFTYAGSVSQPNGVAAKSAWLTDLLKYPLSNACLGMIAYQNEDSGDSDFAIFGGSTGPVQWSTFGGGSVYRVYPSVAAALGNASFGYVGPSSTNPRLIDDVAFFGPSC